MKLVGSIILVVILFYARVQSQDLHNYPAQVGDIAFDATLDDHSFKVCNEKQVQQYYNFGKGFQYKGDKPSLQKDVNRKWKKLNDNVNGFITIRFIVNCEGKSGRFRIQSMDGNYQTVKFSDKANTQIIQLTKSLSGWVVGKAQEVTFDYYQYLTFRVNNGNLIEVTP